MISISEPEYCKIQVKYEADPELISSKKEEVLKKFKTRKVPGFREGKATQEAIKSHFRKEIQETLKSELTQEAYSNALFENNIKPFGNPTFSYIDLDKETFKCEFSVYKQPDFELGTYKDFEIPKPHLPITAEEFSQKMLQELREKHGNTIPYGENDEVRMGDTIILDYKSFIDDQPLEGLTSSGELLNVGRINIPGFSENLVGMKINDTRLFTLKMPETFKEEYANKTITFEVKILMGSRIEPAALDDDFAKKVGVEDYNKLVEAVSSTATSRVEEIRFNQLSDQIIARLLENHSFEIPQWISTAEAQVNARNSNQDWNIITDEQKETHISQAEKSVKLSLILQKVRDNEPDAQLTEEEIFNTIRENLRKHSPEPEKVMADVFKNGHFPLLMNRVRDENTIKFISRNCTIIE